MDLKKLCFELSSVSGSAGDEQEISDILIDKLSKYMPCHTDTLGNVIGTAGEGKIHILLDAHIDRVGMVVRGIDEKGFLLVDQVGHIDLRALTGSEVIVHGRRELSGIISSVPPHLQKGNEKKELDIKAISVDIGYSREKALELVSIGDRISFRCEQNELAGDLISSCAFDDRCSVAAILYALDLIGDRLEGVRLSVMFSVQEEVGCRGAAAGAYSLMPDYAIAVDVGFGSDPYTDKTMTIELGGGPSVGISPILNRHLTRELMSLAAEKKIPCQNDVMSGRTGTNADSISTVGKGVRTALLSIPLRYMHTANEIISLEDVENTARLIAEYVLYAKENYNA